MYEMICVYFIRTNFFERAILLGTTLHELHQVPCQVTELDGTISQQSGCLLLNI